MAKIEDILTSQYVKVITDKLWKDALVYIRVMALFFILFVITLSFHVAYVEDELWNMILFPLLVFF